MLFEKDSFLVVVYNYRMVYRGKERCYVDEDMFFDLKRNIL